MKFQTEKNTGDMIIADYFCELVKVFDVLVNAVLSQHLIAFPRRGN